jgi:iron complex transport system substrate-binding protein
VRSVPHRARTKPLRIISVVPAATEIIIALGAGESLVGVSHQCTLPAGAGALPCVTAGTIDSSVAAADINAQVATRAESAPSLFTLLDDRIAALHPDVIITQTLCGVCAVSEGDVRALATKLTPSPRIVSLGATTLDGVFADITAVAEVLDLHLESERLLSSLRTRMRRVHNLLSASRAPRPRVAVIEWTDPPFAAGHWVPEMVYRAGGTDVLTVSGQHSREVTWDAVADAAPAIVLIAPCGYGVERSAEEGRALVADNAWLQRRTVWALDAAGLVSQPGPCLVDGIETFAAIFSPGLFPVPLVTKAIPLSIT